MSPASPVNSPGSGPGRLADRRERVEQPGDAGHGDLGLEVLDRRLRLGQDPAHRLVAGDLGLGQRHLQLGRRLGHRPPDNLVGRQQPVPRRVQALELLPGRPPPPSQVAQHPLPHHMSLGYQLATLLLRFGPDDLGVVHRLLASLVAGLPQRLGLGRRLAQHLRERLPPLGPAAVELAGRLASKLLHLGQHLDPLCGDGGLSLRPDLVRVVVGLRDQPGRGLLGLLLDVGRRVAGGRQHPRRLLAQQLDQAVLVEPLGVVGSGLGLLGPSEQLGLPRLQGRHGGSQLLQVDPYLPGVEPSPRRGELPVGDASRIERMRLAR
jgi:hypothetical protein